ncbi:MAG: RNA 2',3'-cyclic phosphodiesterase [Phycisphaerales bacterium]
MAARVRLFIAIYPGEAVARSLIAMIRTRSLPEHRLVPVRQVHLTVRFLGETPEAAVAGLGDDLARLAREIGPFPLRVDRLLTLPRTRARLLAAGTDLPEGLGALIEGASLLPGAPIRPGAPTPHLTLARFARGVRARTMSEPIESVEFDVGEMHLVRSDLGPAGATHESIRIAPLGAGHQ